MEETPDPRDLSVHFYSYSSMRRAARGRANLLAAPFLKAATCTKRYNLAHVNVQDGGFVYEAHWRLGFLITTWPYPVSPTLTVPVTMTRMGMTAEDWAGRGFTFVRSVLDCFWCPRIWPVCSCVTETARLLRCESRPRRPWQLYVALSRGDYDGGRHERALRDTESRSPARAGP